MIEILGVTRLRVICIAIVVLVTYVMYLLQRAVLGQLVKAARSEQRVHVLPVLEALPYDLEILFKIGIMDVEVTLTSLFSLLLYWHLSDSLEPWHLISLSIEILD